MNANSPIKRASRRLPTVASCWFAPTAITLLLAVWIISVTPGCRRDPVDPVPVASELSEQDPAVSRLIESEDLILDLTPRLKGIAHWFEGQSEPDRELPADLQTCREIVPLGEADVNSLFHTDFAEPDFLEVAHWPVSTTPSNAALNPWAAADALGVTWETMKFGVIAGDFSKPDQSEFTLHTKVEARGNGAEDVYGMKAYQDLVFSRVGNDWTLVKWRQEDFFVERTHRRLFREMLADVLPDSESLENAQRSFKDEIIVRSSKKGGKITLPVPELSEWEALPSNHIFPAVSVVDYNNDGLDDLFLSSRWGPTQMLQRQPDGSYVDVAEQIGLREPYLVNCVLFVDLDNDGDQDAVMGRPLEPAKILLNDEGHYKDVTKTNSDLGKQYFVCGISATDVNRDGLLDLYLSTYPPLNPASQPFQNVFLESEERTIYNEKQKTKNRWLDLPGSANVLLMNRGDGRLERVDFDDELAQWRRSFQAVWTDFDDDGDDDLYVCNDFSPDALLRNDTPQGSAQPVFVEVTNDVIHNDGIGFGMGASFGDFDQDGDFDLYVSNMFSKAGRRIAKKLGDVDPRIEVAAAGSFLLVNDGGRLDQRAGSEDDQFHVNQIGWSFGGQFVDFNNDGRLDIYVPTGYYTAPPEIATEVDT